MTPASPTGRLLVGLAVTLLAVVAFAAFTLHQVTGLRRLQADTIDRGRRDSLQLLRIQNNLHLLGEAMRDMAEPTPDYPLGAYEAQLRRLRTDLEDAVRRERALAPASRPPGQQQLLDEALGRLGAASDELFAHERAGRHAEARQVLQAALPQHHSALTNLVARLLVQNHDYEEQTAQETQRIYDGVERSLYALVLAVLAAIAATGGAIIVANRRLFARLETLTAEKTTLARHLISVQESVLQSVSRELHDEFGQILTAVGTMLTRAERKGLPPDSPFRQELQEVRAATQDALSRTRRLSQSLHPGILDDHGVAEALDWFVPLFEKQSGMTVHYERQGGTPELPRESAIHVYRIAQEALTNVTRHAGTSEAWVRLRSQPGRLELEVEDHGRGLPAVTARRSGLGMVAMRERAELLGGTLTLFTPPGGGTCVRLSLPMPAPSSASAAPEEAQSGVVRHG